MDLLSSEKNLLDFAVVVVVVARMTKIACHQVLLHFLLVVIVAFQMSEMKID